MAWNDNYPPLDFNIQQQYLNTNIHELLKGIAGVRGLYKSQAIATFKNDVRNLKTAIGGALDLWGNLLGFSRYLPLNIDDPDGQYFQWSFYNRYFNRLQFGRVDENDFARLPDPEYRFILLLLLQGRTCNMTIKALAEMAQDTFSQIGLNCAVFDNFNMEKLSYVVDDIPPLWLSYVVKKYDILPRPAGVGAQLLVDKVLPIGFYRPPPNPPESNKNITNFYYAKFNHRKVTK